MSAEIDELVEEKKDIENQIYNLRQTRSSISSINDLCKINEKINSLRDHKDSINKQIQLIKLELITNKNLGYGGALKND